MRYDLRMEANEMNKCTIESKGRGSICGFSYTDYRISEGDLLFLLEEYCNSDYEISSIVITSGNESYRITGDNLRVRKVE